ncbi:spermidine synthase [Paenibacillus sp. CF384]|uniref:spermidine synthase n=1 Tax=Paenibacillus sp. CF384 TaxID=1884382 RepID=UPI000897C099|nr:fused MFS/spermidine synthase [Paenibacillus sp. CF384]SDX96516.1 spermidine synthase [Paenibacillus sp. CF384]
MQILHRENSLLNEITVYDTNKYGEEHGRFRVLQFSNNAMQGAVDLDQPERILFEYPQAMLHLMNDSNQADQRLFIIGHGVGTIARHHTGTTIKVAELDERVVALSKQYFGYGDDNVVVGDGRELLSCEAEHTVDFIVLDAFSDKGTPRHLTSMSFFELAADKLDESGAILINLMGKRENDAHINAIYTTLREVFRFVKAFALPAENAADRRNYILTGSNTPLSYQTRRMAGFMEMELGQGYIIVDHD